MQAPFARHLIALATSAALLSACGGDSSHDSEEASLRAGDEITTLLLVDGQVVQAEARKVFGVTADGRLTDDPDAATLAGAHVTLATESEGVGGAPTPAVTGTAELQRFLAGLWPALQARYGTTHPERIWAEVDDQDQGLADVYADYQRSGLSLSEWVDFYAAIDEFQLPSAQEGQQERELVQWLAAADVPHVDLLAALAMQGLDWRALLGALQARGQGFDDLRQRWVLQAPNGIAAFIADYLHPASPTGAAREQARLLTDRWERHASGFWLRNPNIAQHWRQNQPPEWRSALADEAYDDEHSNHGRTGYFSSSKNVTMRLCKEKRSKIGAWFYRNDCAKLLSQSSFQLETLFINGIIDRIVLKQTEHYTGWGTATTWATLDKVEVPTRRGYHYASMQFSVGVNGKTDTGVKHEDRYTFKVNGLDGIVD